MFIYQLANVITIFTSLIAALINLAIIRMHIKQPLLMDGFFHVVFGLLITELLVNVSLLLLNLVYVIKTDNAGKFIVTFPILFNLGYIANITYNIRTLIFLMTYNTNREDLINYGISNNNSQNDNITHQTSLSFSTISFKNFHIIAIVVSIIHTVLYIINYFANIIKIEIIYFYFKE